MSESIKDISSKMAAKLEWKEFEHFVSDLWELQGYSTEVTGHHDKEGEDIIAKQEIPFKWEILIQAKRKKKEDTVGKRDIQIYSLDDDAPADLSVIVTTCSFTRGAINYANPRKSTKLVDGEALAKLVKKLNVEDLLNDYLKVDDPSHIDLKKYKFWNDDSVGIRDIKGIGEKYAKTLAQAGIHSISDLAQKDPEDLADETSIAKSQLERWIIEAAYQDGKTDVVKNLVPDKELQAIRGIGPAYADQLKDAGLKTVGDLATADYREIAQKTGFSESTVQDWAQKARHLPR